MDIPKVLLLVEVCLLDDDDVIRRLEVPEGIDDCG